MKQLIASYMLLFLFSLSAMEKDTAEQFCAAIEQNKIKEVRQFIKTGVSVNNHFDNCLTPLMVAAHNGHAKIVKMLLKHGADVNAVDTKHTIDRHCANSALHLASFKNHLEIFKILLAHGAQTVMKNKYGGNVTLNSNDSEINNLLQSPEQIAQLKKDRQDKLEIKAFKKTSLEIKQLRLIDIIIRYSAAFDIPYIISLHRT